MSKIEIIRRPTEEDWVRCYRLALGTEGKGTDKVPTPAWMEKILKMDANAQALISISRKRLCYKAATETRQLWTAVCNAIIGLNPEMLRVLVPDCVYRGKCREMQPCGERNGR